MKRDYEQYLNELFSEIYSADTAYDEFCYLKEGKISMSTVLKAQGSNHLGTLVRRHDPLRFESGYNEWLSTKKSRV